MNLCQQCHRTAKRLPQGGVNTSESNILSQIEKDNGDKARFVTMKLQIYLEDVYISPGKAIVLRPKKLSKAIKELLGQGMKKKAVGKAILKRYKDGKFHDK